VAAKEDAMAWMKVDAARRYAGGVGRKILYKAVAAGHLKAARIGTGRSLLFSDMWIDEWLLAAAREERERNIEAGSGQPGDREMAGASGLRLVGRR
jgi:hypothetical protein